MDNASEYILLGTSFVDQEADENTQEDNDKVVNEAIYKSRSLDIINSIGTYEFKNIYRNLINDIKIQSIGVQKLFFNSVLEKISEVYDFEFPENIDLYTQNDLNNMYSFLKFLEYDNVDFISSVWKFLGIDIMTIDIKKYCFENKMKLILEIEDQIETHELNEIIILFLRTYYKITEWFNLNTHKSKYEIIGNLI